MCAICGWFSDARPRLRVETAPPLAIAGDVGGQHLERDVALQFRIRGAIHLAHAARAKRAHDLVRTEFEPLAERHRVMRDYGSYPRPAGRILRRERRRTT
jgi:hypothetical protein